MTSTPTRCVTSPGCTDSCVAIGMPPSTIGFVIVTKLSPPTLSRQYAARLAGQESLSPCSQRVKCVQPAASCLSSPNPFQMCLLRGAGLFCCHPVGICFVLRRCKILLAHCKQYLIACRAC